MNNKDKINFGTVIDSLNNQLLKSQNEIFINNSEEQITLHVIGAPRSGTTLLTQLMSSHLNIGYINNLIAAFWKSPMYGIHLSKKLLGNNYQSNYSSNYGATEKINEPHEFSYFWKYYLNYSDFLQQTYNKEHHIDWDKLKTILYQMCLAYEKPIVFKSFQYGFHAIEAVKAMPKSLFILIKRDVFQNAYSIYKMREKQHNDINIWASIKPHQYYLLKEESVYRQIMGQVMFLNFEYERQLNEILNKNKLILNYEDLCKNPSENLKLIEDKISLLSSDENKIKDYKIESFKVVNKEIPLEILTEFKKAQKWLIQSFSKLNKIYV